MVLASVFGMRRAFYFVSYVFFHDLNLQSCNAMSSHLIILGGFVFFQYFSVCVSLAGFVVAEAVLLPPVEPGDFVCA